MKISIIKHIYFLVGMAGLACSARGADVAPAAFRPEARVLFQGDSITAVGRDRAGGCWDQSMGSSYAYLIAANLGGHFPELNLTFLNRGVPGNKVANLAARWQQDSIALKPDVLSILIGVNDVWQNLDANKQISYAEVEATYGRVRK